MKMDSTVRELLRDWVVTTCKERGNMSDHQLETILASEKPAILSGDEIKWYHIHSARKKAGLVGAVKKLAKTNAPEQTSAPAKTSYSKLIENLQVEKLKIDNAIKALQALA